MPSPKEADLGLRNRMSCECCGCLEGTELLTQRYSHMNSVDKFPNGDYLVSIRYTSAIYRISKQGKVVWRLGGRKSDFLQDFNFTGQHDARVVSENSTITVLSIFDNASTNDDHIPQSAQSSSFKVVALYEHQSRRRAMVSL